MSIPLSPSLENEDKWSDMVDSIQAILDAHEVTDRERVTVVLGVLGAIQNRKHNGTKPNIQIALEIALEANALHDTIAEEEGE